MAVNIHTNYYQANLQRRTCYQCEKDFIVGKEFVDDRKDDVFCPYCGNECTNVEAWTDDESLEYIELGCLGVYYYKEDEKIEELSVEEDKIRCSKCNEIMSEGYEVHDGLYHYCSDECLHTVMSKEEYKELHEEGFAFWTTFED